MKKLLMSEVLAVVYLLYMLSGMFLHKRVLRIPNSL